MRMREMGVGMQGVWEIKWDCRKSKWECGESGVEMGGIILK